MPYADPEKQREADRKRKARARAEKKAAGVREGNPDVRARVDVHRLSGIGSGGLAGCAGRGFTFNGRAARSTIAT